MRPIWCVVACGAFVAGIAVGVAGAKAKGFPPTIYQGKEAKAAGLALLEAGQQLAGDGSWELIGVGRVYYLSGDKAKGQAIFDKLLTGKKGMGDWERVAKVYLEAGEWSKAEPLFKRAMEADPGDDSIPALAGCFYNLNGDRKRAEELFGRSFEKKPGDTWNTINAAGSYLGVKPD